MAAAPLSENGDDSTPTMEGTTTDDPHRVEGSHAPNGESGYSAPLHEKEQSSKVSPSASFEQAVQLKTQGNSLFAAREYVKAARIYKEGLDYLEGLPDNGQESIDLEVALRANRAMVLLKSEAYSDAQEECAKAIQLDSTNTKVWYRRGLAREGLSSHADDQNALDQAVSDVEQCLSLFPSKPNPAEQKMMKAASEALQRMKNTKEKLQKQTETEATEPPPQDRTSGPPPPQQQRKDVFRLFMARQIQEKKKNGARGMPLDGEAFFLLNWSWWMAWCHYTDFFYMQNSTTIEKRQIEILKLLPPGSSIPIMEKKKKARSTSPTSSSDSDDSDDDELVTQATSGPPDVIDNSCLLVSPPQTATTSPLHDYYLQWNPHLQQQKREDKDGCSLLLLPNLVRGYHYELLPREIYFALRVWYGEITPSICRRVKVVMDPPKAVLKLYPEHTRPSPGRLGGYICCACHKPNVQSRCTRCLAAHYCDRSCQESHWPYHKFACKTISKEQQQIAMEVHELESENLGRVGLNNLGNTCFMNSALQCLSHATPLTRHFLSNGFKADLNATNPLGTGGKLAHAYNVVMKDIWMAQAKGGHSSTSPTVLKRAIAMFAPRFAGCSQHDAQEFLAYLLDGLHEDLNRIRKAPYVEMPTVGPCMAIAGAEAWDAHRLRNDSLVMDTFYGQFKSTCVCPHCNRVSVSFDAFNHVSLEIPQFHTSTRTIPVLVVPSAGGASMNKIPTRYGVTVRRNEFVGDLKRALSELCRIPVTHFIICDIYEHAVYEILQDGKPLSTVKATDVLTAYEVDPYTNTSIHTIASNTCSALKAPPTIDDELDDDEVEDTRGLFGFPFVASFDADLSCKQVWDSLWNQVRLLIGDDEDRVQNGEGQAEEIQYEAYLQSLLKIRIVDNAGIPRPVFLDDDLSNMETMGVVDAASILPRNSNEKLTKFLGRDCTDRFLFVHLEWRDPTLTQDDGEEPYRHVPSFYSTDRFLSFVDHPSLQGLQKQRAMMNGFKGVTIEQCFDTFTRPERLDEHNKWYCSRCKEHVRAMKTMQLWRLPNILVVHLKRFEFKHALRRDKLDTLVDFPLDGLDMSKHCASASVVNGAKSETNNDAGDQQSPVFVVEDGVPAIYDLFAVTNHYGRLGFGHYTAFARKWNEEGMSQDWALFDDSSVRSVGDGRGGNDGLGVVSPAAYVLFYRRRVFN